MKGFLENMLPALGEARKAPSRTQIASAHRPRTILRSVAFSCGEFSRLNKSVSAMRPPLLNSKRFGLKNNFAGRSKTLIVEYRIVIADLLIHPHRWIGKHPHEENQSSGIPQNKFSTAVAKLARTNRAPRVMPISKLPHFVIKMVCDDQSISKSQSHERSVS